MHCLNACVVVVYVSVFAESARLWKISAMLCNECVVMYRWLLWSRCVCWQPGTVLRHVTLLWYSQNGYIAAVVHNCIGTHKCSCLFQLHTHTGGYGGGQSGRGPPSGLSVGLGPSAVKDFYHTEMAYILVSVYCVFFQPHWTSEPITINNVYVIDLVNTCTCIITSSDSSLARHLITYSISTKLSEWNKAAKCRTLEALRECKSPTSHFYIVDCWLNWG